MVTSTDIRTTTTSANTITTTVDTTTNTDELALLRLLQLTSPSFPVGAYAYSQGLELAVERGWVSDPESLSSWVRGVLEHSLAETDLALSFHARRAFERNADREARELSRLLVALRETRELRAEERQLGASLARALVSLGVERAQDYVGSDDASYVTLFALAGVHFGVGAREAAQGFAFAWCENQVLAAARLFAFGQTAAQQVLLGLAEAIPRAVRKAELVPRDEIGRSAVGVCMASAWHERQYSRLFRS
jgi:urease accessory protein